MPERLSAGPVVASRSYNLLYSAIASTIPRRPEAIRVHNRNESSASNSSTASADSDLSLATTSSISGPIYPALKVKESRSNALRTRRLIMEEERMTKQRKFWRWARPGVIVVILGWCMYCTIRYGLATRVYSKDPLRRQFAIAFTILTTFSLVSFLVSLFLTRKPAIYRTSIFLFASLLLVIPSFSQLALLGAWRRPPALILTAVPLQLQRSLHERCQWDVDIVWSGEGGRCAPGVAFAGWVVGILLRFLSTLTGIWLWNEADGRWRTLEERDAENTSSTEKPDQVQSTSRPNSWAQTIRENLHRLHTPRPLSQTTFGSDSGPIENIAQDRAEPNLALDEVDGLLDPAKRYNFGNEELSRYPRHVIKKYAVLMDLGSTLSEESPEKRMVQNQTVRGRKLSTIAEMNAESPKAIDPNWVDAPRNAASS